MHAAHERALALEELADLFAARSASHERVPAICALSAGGLATLDFDVLAAVEGTAEDAFELFGTQLAQHAHAELTDQVAHGSLQPDPQLPVGGDELETAVDARHRAYGDEAPAGAAGQPLDQSSRWGIAALR